MGADAEFVLVFDKEKDAELIHGILNAREYSQKYIREDKSVYSYCLFDVKLEGLALYMGCMGRYYDEYYPRGNMRYLYEMYLYLMALCEAYEIKCVVHYVNDYMPVDETTLTTLLTPNTIVTKQTMKALLKHYKKYNEEDE